MGFINLNLGDVKESKNVPAGKYRLVISSFEETESREKKTPQLKIVIAVEGHDDAMPVNHYVPLASAKDDQKTAMFKNLLLARFLSLFKVPFSAEGFNPEDMIGCSADAELQLTEPNDNGDVYNRLVVPKLATEADAPAQKKTAAVAGKKR